MADLAMRLFLTSCTAAQRGLLWNHIEGLKNMIALRLMMSVDSDDAQNLGGWQSAVGHLLRGKEPGNQPSQSAHRHQSRQPKTLSCHMGLEPASAGPGAHLQKKARKNILGGCVWDYRPDSESGVFDTLRRICSEFAATNWQLPSKPTIEPLHDGPINVKV